MQHHSEPMEEASTPLISNRGAGPPPPILTLPVVPFLPCRFSPPHSSSSTLLVRPTANQLQLVPQLVPLLTLDESPWGVLCASLCLLLKATLQRLLVGHGGSPLSLLGVSTTTVRPFSSSATLLIPATTLTTNNPTVRGIPNYGQTCFLNSVLQAMGSLEPFLVYLERLVEVNQDRIEFSSVRDEHESFVKKDHHDKEESVSAMLLALLRTMNGTSSSLCDSRRSMDTRPLLQRIASKHSQFQSGLTSSSSRFSVGKEQQDAQEFLQALVEAVVDEAEFQLVSSTVPSAFIASLANPHHSSVLRSDDDDDDELLTVASSLREQRNHNSNAVVPPAVVTKEPCSEFSYQEGSTDSIGKLSQANCANQMEEKKQEDFEVHVPRVCSEENMMELGRVPLERVPISALTDSDSLMSDVDGGGREKGLSAALQIVLSTTSSLSPSPFCGWMGSALQCRTCRHVRPIPNTPLVDIPVVPTAVSHHLGSSQPGKLAPSGPPCRLEECLSAFTAVERVQGVECRCCTLRQKRTELEEDLELYSGALESCVSKQGQHLQLELERVQKRLQALDAIGVDDDDDDDHLWKQVFGSDEALSNGDTGDFTMERHDSYKCLMLTRLPALLTIHVQRRYYDPVQDRMTKTTQHVIFPEFLDISPYCATGSPPGGVRTSSTASIPIQYRLQAVIEHRGDAFFGHYVCYRRDVSNTDQWLHVSDKKVTKVDWSCVRQCQAYMLFYEAISFTL